MIEKFTQYLLVKGLQDNTIRGYLDYYRHFNEGLKKEDLTQAYTNNFLIKYSSNHARYFVKNLFNFLEITHLKVPKFTGRKPKKKRRSLTPQEIKVLRQWLYSNKKFCYLLCFDISYYCALRRAEVMKIKIPDFNLKSWAENPKKACRLLIRGKGKRERYVPVNLKIMENILKYINDQDKLMSDDLFGFSTRIWNDAFKDAVKSTMDYNFTLHDLRRSRATEWLQKGVDLVRVRERLGHASVSTTQLYINLDEEKEFDSWANEIQ